jgi:hypothetical protein
MPLPAGLRPFDQQYYAAPDAQSDLTRAEVGILPGQTGLIEREAEICGAYHFLGH